MTNAEKYLKDGVDIGQLAREITELSWSNDDCLEDNITLYFRQQAKPTLTEDERVILRNIDKHFTLIKREKETGNIFVQSDSVVSESDWDFIVPFNHLFQFIKERRRI